MRDLVVSQRFSPEFGGSITWLKEVYQRWPYPVDIFTHSYPQYNPAQIKKEDSALKKAPSSRIHEINREDIFGGYAIPCEV